MKKSLKIIICMILVMIISTLYWIVINKLSITTMAAINENNAKAAVAPCEDLYIRIVQENPEGERLWRPIPENKIQEVYCVEPGASLRPTGITKEEVEAYAFKFYSHSGCGCAKERIYDK